MLISSLYSIPKPKKSKTGVLLLVCSFGGGWWRDARVSTGAYVANHNPAVSDERVCVPPTESRLPFHTHTHIETEIVTGHLCLGFLYPWFVHSNYTRRNRKSLFLFFDNDQNVENVNREFLFKS